MFNEARLARDNLAGPRAHLTVDYQSVCDLVLRVMGRHKPR